MKGARAWIWLLILAAALVLGVVPAAQALGFTAPASYPVGDSPEWIVGGNFNGDTDPDLVVANKFSGNVSVLLGGAGASFGAAANYGAGTTPTSVATGDFDADSDLDLAVTNGEYPSGTYTVSILLGAGDGSFGSPTAISSADELRRVAVADFNGDADPDLAVTEAGHDVVAIRLGGAGATFGAATLFGVADSPGGLAVADFNVDGSRDLAVANRGSDSVSILLGAGDGTFGAATHYPVGDNPFSVAVGDFNADSDPDLAVPNLWSDDVAVLLGGVAGTFGTATRYPAGFAVEAVAVGDLNGDGDPDLAVSNNHVLLGGAGGSFGAATRVAAGGGSSVAIGDFNADGDRDLATANRDSDTVSILLNRANAPALPTLTGTNPASPANDNAPKVRGTAPAGSTVRLYTTSDCSGAAAATGSAADFASTGLAVAVPDDSTTTFRATATNAADVPSDCSTSSVTYVEHSSPPRAALAVSPNPVLTGSMVTFDARSSTGFGISRYEWDLDGNGSFETDTGASPTATSAYTAPAELAPAVRVSNDIGSSEARAALSVRLTPPPGAVGVSINRGAQFTNDPTVTIAAVWPPLARTILISNDGGFGNATGRPVAAETEWILDSSGPERLPKTVYVRFDESSQTFTDDIILDETPPQVTSATATPGGFSAASAVATTKRMRTHQVRIDARDRTSGVSGIQVTSDRRKPGKLRSVRRSSRLRRSVVFRTASARIYVRVRDAAGNYSRWRQAKRPRRR